MQPWKSNQILCYSHALLLALLHIRTYELQLFDKSLFFVFQVAILHIIIRVDYYLKSGRPPDWILEWFMIVFSSTKEEKFKVSKKLSILSIKYAVSNAFLSFEKYRILFHSEPTVALTMHTICATIIAWV